MLFNSYVFWAFFALVLPGAVLLRGTPRKLLLLIASYVFYGFWDWRFLSLILLSTLVDYYAAQAIDRTRDQNRSFRFLLISVFTNLGLLAFFKYFDFFTVQLAQLLATLGFHVAAPLLDVVLPVGISFYTFQTLGYTIDVYRGHTKATREALDLALFVAFFPQLVAGPIERSDRLLPQIQNDTHPVGDSFREGLYLIISGLFRKVVIADNMAVIANAVFAAEASELTGPEVLVGAYAFAFQIYGDFSGYSSVARGVSRWLGIDLTVNFRRPYFARDPTDFWRRWHISLSSWFRDYLYIPLGGNRTGAWNTCRNLLLVMLLGGLWHGAGWTFVIWGALHGAILCVYRLFGIGRGRRTDWHLVGMLEMVVTFHLVCLGWLLFRAETVEQAWSMLTLLVTDTTVTSTVVAGMGLILFYCGPLIAYETAMELTEERTRLTNAAWWFRGLAYSYCVSMMLFFPPPTSREFIYFQF